MPQIWTVYDGANTYADFDGNGNLTNRYLYGLAIDQLFGKMDANGNTRWYLTDLLGSVRQVANPTGGVLDTVNFDSFGNILSESSPANGDRFKYTGREWDATIGFQFSRARYYDPATGRWTTPDPIGFAGLDANLSRYCFNNPTQLVDPNGQIAAIPPDMMEIIQTAIGQNQVMSVPGSPPGSDPRDTDEYKKLKKLFEDWTNRQLHGPTDPRVRDKEDKYLPQLDNEDYQKREQAATEIIKLGPGAAPKVIEELEKNPSLDRRRWLMHILRQLENNLVGQLRSELISYMPQTVEYLDRRAEDWSETFPDVPPLFPGAPGGPVFGK
jgi:RHS repeat-associated protein